MPISAICRSMVIDTSPEGRNSDAPIRSASGPSTGSSPVFSPKTTRWKGCGRAGKIELLAEIEPEFAGLGGTINSGAATPTLGSSGATVAALGG